ncbi:MAG: MBL fold metallo-hydrolase [Sphingobacteriales bacterium]|nr:MBL fold metallo-hydrolase [Sphingobacteriales bacterium]
MLQVHYFTFNDFRENTYLVWDDSLACLIIDPGCSTAAERKELSNFIAAQQLQPCRLLNTHCHIDHIFGNAYIADRYGLGLEIHEGEVPILQGAKAYTQMWGMHYEESPQPQRFISEKDEISFGNGSVLKILFTPGHSPASICFYSAASQFVIGGDVLFEGSIGRTDLPGGNYNTLIRSIKTQLLTLPDHVKVYAGHGDPTTIGTERRFNPFLKE